MSLDVSLTIPGETHTYESRIFVREDGQTKELTREEWDQRFPGQKPFSFSAPDTNFVFEANITSNLGRMADAVGIYMALWRPDEIGITKANQLIEPLTEGLKQMESDPKKFKAFNPSNGWGSYDDFVPWLRRYLNACIEYPEADVSASR
jgi:hypothetical protein